MTIAVDLDVKDQFKQINKVNVTSDIYEYNKDYPWWMSSSLCSFIVIKPLC